MQRVIHRLRNIVSAWILAKSDEDRSTTTQPNDERNRTDGRKKDERTKDKRTKEQRDKGRTEEKRTNEEIKKGEWKK